MLLRRWVRASVVSGLLLAACGEGSQVPGGSTGPEEPGPTPIPAPVLGVVASAPVARALLGQAGPGSVAFVAAPVGTVARGRGAVLVNRRTGARVEAVLAAGGFDPVALVADDGDVVEVTLSDSAGQVTTTPLAVKRGTKPRVVRTSPGPHLSDVPLNIVIEVVFSAPMDTVSVAASLRLRRGDALVPGAVVFRDADRTTAAFVPGAPLEPGREYTIELDGEALDVLGQALDSGVATTFSTIAFPGEAPVRDILIEAASTVVLRPGEAVELRARVCVRLSLPCEEVVAPITWYSSPGVVSLAPQSGSMLPARAVVTAVSAGSTEVFAISGTDRSAMPVRVLSPAPASLAANEIVFVRDLDLFAVRADGTGLRQLTTGVTVGGAPSVAADGRIVFEGSPPGSSGPYVGVRDIDGSVRFLPLPPPRNGAQYCPTWSPDMRYIAYLEARGKLYSDFFGKIRVVYADSSTVLAADVASLEMTCPSWSARGDLVAAERRTGGDVSLKVLTLAGQEAFVASGSFLPGELSPDGGEIVTMTYGGSPLQEWIARRSMVGPSERRLFFKGVGVALGAGAQYTPPKWSPDGSLIAIGSRAYGMILLDASNGEPQWLGDTWGGDYDMGFWPFGYDPTFVPAGVRFTR